MALTIRGVDDESREQADTTPWTAKQLSTNLATGKSCNFSPE